MGSGECCSGFGERVRQIITRKFSVTGDPLEAKSYVGGERTGKVPNISEGFS